MSEPTPYGDYQPMPGEPPRDPAMRGAPPPSVQTAVKLMFARAALGLLGLLVLLATRGTLQQQIQNADAGLSADEVETATNAAVTIGIVFGLLFIGLYVLLALQVRKGKSWARIVTLVLAGLGVLTGLASLLQEAPALSRVVALITLVVDAGILFLLLQKPSAQYFRRAPS